MPVGKFLSIALFCVLLCAGCTPSAEDALVQDRGPGKDPIQEIGVLFDRLETAYATEDVDLFVSCYDPRCPGTDIVRNTDTIYTEEMTRTELEGLFAMLDQIQVDFTAPQILVDRDVAMARTVRHATAAGFPHIYVEFSYVLRRDGKGQSKWRIASEVLLSERYDELAGGAIESSQSEEQVSRSGRQTGVRTVPRIF